MIIGTPDGKYYNEIWHESDNFKKKRIVEITPDRMKENCINSQDYVVFRKLSMEERLRMLILEERI